MESVTGVGKKFRLGERAEDNAEFRAGHRTVHVAGIYERVARDPGLIPVVADTDDGAEPIRPARCVLNVEADTPLLHGVVAYRRNDLPIDGVEQADANV